MEIHQNSNSNPYLSKFWVMSFIVVFILSFSGCERDQLKVAAEDWCKCVHEGQNKNLSDNQIYLTCEEMMLKNDDYLFFHILNDTTKDFSYISNKEFHLLHDDYMTWHIYRMEICDFGVPAGL